MSKRTFALEFAKGSRRRLVSFGFFGIAPMACVAVVLVGIDVTGWTNIDHAGDIPLLVLAGLALLACMIVPPIVLRLRDPGPVSVTLDEWGVTERDGDDVRTAIPWSKATWALVEHKTRDRRTGRTEITYTTLSVVGDDGFVVNVVFGDVMLPAWMRRRRLVSYGETFSDSFFADKLARRRADVAIDARDQRRRLLVFSRIVGGIQVAASWGIAAAVPELGRTQDRVAVLSFLVAVCLLCRCLRPLFENARLRMAARACAGAKTYDLSKDDRPTLDFSGVRHPDALIETRGIRVHAVTDGWGDVPGSPYRGDAPTTVVALETDRDRRERARIARANRIEIGLRLLLAVLVAVLCVVCGMHEQEH